MTSREIARYRQANQMIGNPICSSPGDVVKSMGAMQAQDYLACLWAVGARLPDASEADIERAIADRKIVRTWPMRGTLHLIAPDDVRWTLQHLAPRLITAAARRHRELELDASVFSRSEKIFVRALKGGKVLARPEMMTLLERARITTASQRGYHILWRLALEGVLCCGPRQGKQQTFVLLDEWIPRGRRRSREEELADYALRYFTSHGPATIEDLAWWIGLKKSEAAEVLDSISPKLSSFSVDGSRYWLASSTPAPRKDAELHLLPSFDELLLGYTDRNAAIPPGTAKNINPVANGMFMPIIVKSGRVIGTWKRTLVKAGVSLTSKPFAAFTKMDSRAWTTAAKRYARFLGFEQKRPNTPSS